MRADELDALHLLRRHLTLPSVARPLHLAWLGHRHARRAAALAALLDLADGPEVQHLDVAAHRALQESPAPTQTTEAPAGDRLGPWRIDGLLGTGGMGSVFLAHRDDGAYRQQVAIKRIHAGAAAATFTGPFLREREILARLNHPGISRLIDGGIDDRGRPWLAMELIDGEPIDRWCDRQRLSLRARATLFLQVCDAVQHAHRCGIVHGDLKPANLLVNADGFAKLLDFGVASLVDEAAPTAAPAIGLTEAYASPERLAHAPASSADDLYSLGLANAQVGEMPVDVAVDRRDRGMGLDLRVHGGLGVRRLIALVVSPSPVAHEVDDHVVLLEVLEVLHQNLENLDVLHLEFFSHKDGPVVVVTFHELALIELLGLLQANHGFIFAPIFDARLTLVVEAIELLNIQEIAAIGVELVEPFTSVDGSFALSRADSV